MYSIPILKILPFTLCVPKVTIFNSKKLRSHFYRVVYLILLVNMKMVYEAETCCWINIRLKNVVFGWFTLILIVCHGCHTTRMSCFKIISDHCETLAFKRGKTKKFYKYFFFTVHAPFYNLFNDPNNSILPSSPYM